MEMSDENTAYFRTSLTEKSSSKKVFILCVLLHQLTQRATDISLPDWIMIANTEKKKLIFGWSHSCL